MAQKKAKAQPKRDPNRPLPKPPKKQSVVLKVLVGGVVLVLVTWLGLYSADIGKAPWDWDQEDLEGFKEFSEGQVAEARQQVEKVDWEALKDKIGEKTRELWDKVPALESKLEAKLAELRKSRQAGPSSDSTGSGGGTSGTTPGSSARRVDGRAEPEQGGDDVAAGDGQAGSATGDAPERGEATAPAVVAPSQLELGCDAMRSAIRHYRKSMNSQKQLKTAKGLFIKAQGHFEGAYAEAERAGDAAGSQEIEGYIMECNTYLEDCSKRETL